MKFNLPVPLPRPERDESLRIGNVYACKGGGKTAFWVVVGLDDRCVNLLGINRDGVVTSTQNYGRHVFEGSASSLFKKRALLGRCEGLEGLDFDVQWYGENDE